MSRGRPVSKRKRVPIHIMFERYLRINSEEEIDRYSTQFREKPSQNGLRSLGLIIRNITDQIDILSPTHYRYGIIKASFSLYENASKDSVISLHSTKEADVFLCALSCFMRTN